MGKFGEFIKGINPFNRVEKGAFGFLPSKLPVNESAWGAEQFMRANEISLYTNKAVQKRSEKVGEIDFVLTDKRGEVIENDPLFELLKRPNKIYTGRQFWGLYQKYLDLVGEVYIYLERSPEFGTKQGKVSAMHFLQPTRVKPKFADTGDIIEFEYKVGGGKTKIYEPHEVLYIFNPDPSNPLRGQSLLKAGINAIQTETQISTYHSRILENGGKVEGVFKFKAPNLTQNQIEEMKDRYQKQYGSAKKAGLPLFMGGDADYIQTGLTPSDLSFLEAKKMTLDDISMLTGVPKALLGVASGETFANADASIRIFLRETIRPLLQTLTSALDEMLFPDERTLDFIDPTPENVEDELKELESGLKNSYMTINEARERRGLDPVDGGDDILVPFNLMPLGEDKNAPISLSVKKKEMNHPLRDPEIRKMWGKVQLKRLDKRTGRFKKELNTYLKEQRERIVQSISTEQGKGITKGLLDESINLDEEVRIGRKLFFPVLRQLMIEAGEDALDLVDAGREFNVTAQIGEHLDSRMDLFLTSMNTTTFGKLKGEFEQSFAEGESRQDLVKRIEVTYDDITKNRAFTIARTEVHNVTQNATMEAYKQAGFNIKIWVWAAGVQGGVREEHQALDGQERPIDVAFSNGQMHPAEGSASQTINCQCTI